MTICLFLHDLTSGGGTERMAVSLANALAQRGHTLHLVSLAPAGTPFFPLAAGVTAHSLNIPVAQLTWRYFAAIKRLRAVVKRIAPAYVIDVDVILSAISIPACRRTATRVVAWEHYNYFAKRESRVRVWGRRLAARKATAVVTLTREDADNYRRNCTCRAYIVTIPNFIAALPADPAQLNSRTVLAVGHLIPRKGFDLLLQAWALLKEDDDDFCGWELHVVGDGEEKENLLALARSLGIAEDVTFLPPDAHIDRHYRSAALYVMSSRAEGFGMVLIEAMSFGLPVVSFACPLGPAEIIRHGTDGFLVAPESVPGLRDALRLLLQRADLRRAMGADARIRVRRFLASEIVPQWENLLKSL
jgi:glycosyltransferase involved in cell wall biosynthesis